ncbi:hypothetical protein LB467_16710 [Salegentibacter sp. JZCK2]|uniref:hypothetical protein n=1 Tax=Salegentibacter tibetensis TaxID=2873600 RepID=UPI001CCDBDB0|nr:hypothetical protein [Salegentibacter tibetensis]MBZ9731333.1 hypothetical protein [Salegentibacter tibetensis]
MNNRQKFFLVVFSFFTIGMVFSQETLQTVTERGNTTTQRLGLYLGGVIANHNLLIDGPTMDYRDPVFINGNLDYLGIALKDAAIRFDTPLDAIDNAPSSLIFAYPNSGIPYVRRFGQDHTIFKIWSPRNSNNAYESTLALVNGDGEEEFLDLYNMNYPTNRTFGIRMQKRGTGQYKPFHFEYSDGSETYPVFTLKSDKSSYFYGNMSIGALDSKGYMLAVAGDFIAESATVKLEADWPDYVFSEEYSLMSLSELEKYIQINKRLPNLPSADEVKEDGIDLGEMNRKFLEKIEEITLHIIKMNKDYKDLREENSLLRGELEKLKKG